MTIVEKSRLAEVQARAATQMEGEAGRVRNGFIDVQSEHLAKRTGSTVAAARRAIERQCAGTLLPDVELQFDDPDLAGKTVADVLANPDHYVGETLADPNEGVEYGRGKAKVLRRADGSILIHSFAHGRTTYELRIGYAMALAALEQAPAEDLDRLFVRFVLDADLDPTEIERLRNLVAKRSGIGKRALDAALKVARAERDKREAREEGKRRAAERRDPRPAIPAPAFDAEWLPQMDTLCSVLGAASGQEPPARNAEKAAGRLLDWTYPSLHALTQKEVNEDE